MNRRPQLAISAPGASPEQAAAIVAALEQYMRDTAPAHARPSAAAPAPWARTGLLEATGHAPDLAPPWGDRGRWS